MRKITLALFISALCAVATLRSQTFQFSYFTETYSELTGGTAMLAQNSFRDSIISPFKIQIGDSLSNKLHFTVMGNMTTEKYSVQSKWFHSFDCETNSGKYSYLVEGNPGSRILKMQFKDLVFAHDWQMTSFMNFQVWIYEDNSIEVRYGSSGIFDAFTCYYPGRGGPGVGFKNLMLKDSPTAPNTGSGNINLNGTPPPDMVYRFEGNNPNGLKENKLSGTRPSLYPVPVISDLRITMPGKKYADIEIADVSGRVVASWKKWDLEKNIDASALSPGTYMLRADGYDYRKFVKS